MPVIKRLERDKTLREILNWFNPLVGSMWQGASLDSGYTTYADYPANRLTASYYPIFRRMRFDLIEVYVAGAGDVGARIRLGLYNDNPIEWWPSSLILDAGEVNAETTGIKIRPIDLILDPRKYWIAFITNDPTIDLYYGMPLVPYSATIVDLEGTATIDQTYGALPDPFPANPAMESRIFYVRCRIAELL